ncbi:MAG: RidA family protein [Coriobacteriales bacterium]|jgi:2-iminobutanoate/2-iminopropanoate deaminase|nr:RidA family protein [Coriobacteriales bacterium]
MERTVITTDAAPAAIGPYAQANRVGGLLFTSGQIPLDPATGEPVGTTVAEQTEQVLKNLKAVLEEGGSSLDAVVKTTVFMADMGDFAQMNEVYARFFVGPALPSRSAVAVKGLPKGSLVEIEAVALAKG